MSTLYLMCGLPFSGKSYTGKKLAILLHAYFLSYDELWKEMFDKTGQDCNWHELSAIAHERIVEHLRKGKDVIYDTLNDTAGNRDSLRQLAQKCSSQTFIIFLDTPLEKIRERQKENEKANIRHSVPEEKFQESVERFEPPINEANVIIIRPNTDLETILPRKG